MSIPNYEGRLFEEKPKIKEYYNFKKNIGIDYRRLTPGSGQLIWLKCPVCGYEWQTEVRHFTGCNCCAGNVIMPGFNDVATLFPELLLDFDPTLNPGINLSEEPFSSAKVVTWVCHKCGHKWTAQIYSRIAHEGSRKYVTMCKKCMVFKTRQEKHPEVFQYLDLTKNTPYEIASDGKLEFKCPDHGNFKKTWVEMIKYYNKNGCLPCCKAGKLPKPKKEGVKYLSDYTELVKEYSPNNTKSPDELTENSSCVVGWFCQKHGEYHMQVRYRTIHGRGCPTCRDENNYFYAHRDEIDKIYSPKNKKPFSDIRAYSDEDIILVCEKGHEFTKKPSSISSYKNYDCPICQKIAAFEKFKASILGAHENIKSLWDEEKNYDYYVTQNNSFDNWYQFFGKCNAGHEDFFDVRAIARNGGTCPYCAERKVDVGVNDLKTLRPDLEAKWSDKNDRQMEEFFTDSSYPAGWHCDECGGHFTRTIREMCEDDSCPYCTNKKVLPGYNDVTTKFPVLADEAYDIGNYMIGTKLNECNENSKKWSYNKCPDCGEVYRMRICDRAEKAERGHRECPNCNYIAKNRVIIF